MKDTQHYTIKEVSELSGLPESTLRFYESKGIINSISRDPSSKHRIYSEDDLNSAATLGCLSATGMSIEEMKLYVKNSSSKKVSTNDQIAILEKRKRRLTDEERGIKLRRKYVELKIDYWGAIANNNKKEAEAIAEKAKVLAKSIKQEIRINK